MSEKDELPPADLSKEQMVELLRTDVKGWNRWRESVAGTLEQDGLKISGVPFNGPDLSNENFAELDLSGANLRQVNLSYSTLTDSNLHATNLSFASLFGAKLDGANLDGARLFGVDLTKADLTGTDFRRAKVRGVHFSTDLSKAKGLDEVAHMGPSYLDLRFFQSHAPLPEVFLKGVGWSDRLIENRYALTESIQFYSVFISYDHGDRAFAEKLYDALQSQGVRCWLDSHDVLMGDHITETVETSIRFFDKIVFCCSEGSLKSKWVDKEIAHAMAKEDNLWDEKGGRVLSLIPIRIDDYVFTWAGRWAGVLRDRNIGDFTKWEDETDFMASVHDLMRALDMYRPPLPTPKLGEPSLIRFVHQYPDISERVEQRLRALHGQG